MVTKIHMWWEICILYIFNQADQEWNLFKKIKAPGVCNDFPASPVSLGLVPHTFSPLNIPHLKREWRVSTKIFTNTHTFTLTHTRQPKHKSIRGHALRCDLLNYQSLPCGWNPCPNPYLTETWCQNKMYFSFALSGFKIKLNRLGQVASTELCRRYLPVISDLAHLRNATNQASWYVFKVVNNVPVAANYCNSAAAGVIWSFSTAFGGSHM